MNDTANRRDVPPPKLSDWPAHLIGFRLCILPVPELSAFAPPSNLIGLVLLKHALEAALRGRGVQCQGGVVGVELNNARGMYWVTDRLAGLEAVKAFMEKSSLAHFARIGWYDPAEDVWRTFFPADGRPEDLGLGDAFTPESFVVLQRQVQEKLAQAVALKKWLDKNPSP